MGEPAVWTSSQRNYLVINITSLRGLMLANGKDTSVIAKKIRKALR